MCLGCCLVFSVAQVSQVAEKALRSQDMVGADDDLPVLGIFGDLVSTPHLRIGDATDDKHHQARHVLHVWRVLVLVPVPIALAGWS